MSHRRKSGPGSPLAVLYAKRQLPEKNANDVMTAVYMMMDLLKKQQPIDQDAFESCCTLLVMLVDIAQQRRNTALHRMLVPALSNWFDAGDLRVQMNRPAVELSTTQRRNVVAALSLWETVITSVTLGELTNAALAWQQYRINAGGVGRSIGLVHRLTDLP